VCPTHADNNAWEGGSKQQVTWTFKGAVPTVNQHLAAQPIRGELIQCGRPSCTRRQEHWLARRHRAYWTRAGQVLPQNRLLSRPRHLREKPDLHNRQDAKMATPPEINNVAIPRRALWPSGASRLRKLTECAQRGRDMPHETKSSAPASQQDWQRVVTEAAVPSVRCERRTRGRTRGGRETVCSSLRDTVLPVCVDRSGV